MGSSPILSMRSAVFLLFALIVLATAQRIDRYTIDDFSLGVNDQRVTYTAPNPIDIPDSEDGIRSELSSRRYSGCVAGLEARLIGCAREMFIDVYISWDIASPKAGRAQYWIQYDGGDGTTDVNFSGLGSIDL